MTKRRIIVMGLALGLLLPLGTPQATQAGEPATIELTIKDHRFAPAEIHVPTGRPVILRITNADDTAEEFDSTALQVEKVIVGGHYATVRLRPLGAGRYPFMGEYHPATAVGAVVADP